MFTLPTHFDNRVFPDIEHGEISTWDIKRWLKNNHYKAEYRYTNVLNDTTVIAYCGDNFWIRFYVFTFCKEIRIKVEGPVYCKMEVIHYGN